MAARAALFDRIERLELGLGQLSSIQIATEVEDFRRFARDHGFGSLADMAHAFETRLANGVSLMTLRSWIEALKEATGCDELDQSSVRSWLAALGPHWR